MRNAVILIKSIFNQNSNHYYYQMLWFLSVLIIYNITNISEGISGKKQVHLRIEFKNQSTVCNSSHNVLLTSIDLAIDTVLLF